MMAVEFIMLLRTTTRRHVWVQLRIGHIYYECRNKFAMSTMNEVGGGMSVIDRFDKGGNGGVSTAFCLAAQLPSRVKTISCTCCQTATVRNVCPPLPSKQYRFEEWVASLAIGIAVRVAYFHRRLDNTSARRGLLCLFNQVALIRRHVVHFGIQRWSR
jgi:hypothetical protein